MAAKKKPRKRETKRLNVALQGGGSHGAFGWGVLDAFLEDGRIDFDGICATSAGAINAVALAHGLTIGNRETARLTLETVWRKVSEIGTFYSPIKRMPWEYIESKSLPYEEAFSYALFETFTNAFSPYQFNPLNVNPLRQILNETVDIEAVQKCQKLKLFVTTTEVRTGRGRIFTNKEITTDVVLASACLPFLFQAVKIGDEYYWDGGYVGNPSLWPLFYNTDTADLCVVHINPIDRSDLPKTPYDITNRMNEITFNVSLMSELRAIAFVKKLIENDMLKDKYKDGFKDILLHAIRADDELKDYSVASKFATDWPFLVHLRDRGRAAAKAWLKENFKHIGVKATVDIHDDFLDYKKVA